MVLGKAARAALIILAGITLPPETNAQAVRVSTTTTSVLATECGKRSDLVLDFCLGYVLATYDALSSVHAICPPAGASTEQAVAIGRQYLKVHPETWHLHPSWVLKGAFTAAFPCSGR